MSTLVKSSKFTSDKIASALKVGRRDSYWGLNLNVFPMEADELREQYLVWKEKAEQIMVGTGAYFSPFEHIHVTASSPAPFRHPGHSNWTDADRSCFTDAWIEALRDNCSVLNDEWPKRPFPLVFERLELHGNCGIVLLEDPTNSVSRIRQCVSRCPQHPALCAEKMKMLVAQSGFRSPSIIHCTVMRLTGEYMEDFDSELEARWARVAREWTRCVVTAQRMTFVKEIVAYQHFRQSEGLIAEFPYN